MRDRSFDGRFYYAMKNSEVVCRPSCTARTPHPERIIVFDTLQQALDAGYRPCRRCCPDIEDWEGTGAELAARLKQWIEENYTEHFSLDAAAEYFHMDKNYLIRVFRKWTGTTMLKYHHCIRCTHAKEMLTHPEYSISYISSEVGYKTPAHFTRIFRQTVGMTPMEYRKQHYASFL